MTDLTDLTVSGTITAAQVVGAFTGGLTGNVSGDLVGGQILPTADTYTGADAGTLAISPAVFHAKLTKGSAGAYTLAAPGAANVGHIMVIECGSAFAHVITVAGLAGGNTLTMTNVIGAAATLYAVSATVWGIIGLGGAVQSQVG
jgi:hypothetical protein